MPRVTVLARRENAFVRRDFDIFRRHFETEVLLWTDFAAPLRVIEAVNDGAVLFSWFAGAHAAFAAMAGGLRGAKTVVSLGGYDCTGLEDIHYGAFADPIRSSLVRIAVDKSDAVLAVDRSLVDELHGHYPSPREILVVPTGYDTTFWTPHGSKENLVLTVGSVNLSNAVRKGFYTFALAAAKATHLRFVLVGATPDRDLVDKLKAMSQGRLEIQGRLDDQDLRDYYRRASVYCQLSRFEGLPNALCEAMLCGCVPVGTKVCGIPTAIGDTGEYCNYGDAQGALESIDRALTLDGTSARQRIAELFPIERREKRLMEVVNRLSEGLGLFDGVSPRDQ